MKAGLVIGVGIATAAVLGGFALHALVPQSANVSSATPSKASDCRVLSSSMLSTQDLAGFTQTNDGTIATGPIPFMGRDPSATMNHNLVAWRSRGWMATVAISGPDRPDEDAHERTLGYTPQAVPLVYGEVVAHNPGLLEVNQTNYAESDLAGALELYGGLSPAHISQPDMPQVVDFPAVGDARLAYTEVDPDPHQKRILAVVVRSGNTVLSFGFAGGAGLTSSMVAPYVTTALSRLKTCG